MADDRPHVVRNLMAELNAVPAPTPPINGVRAEAAPVDGVPAEDAERVLAERIAAAERQRFAERWGYDVLLDKPVDGGGWEYEQIHPPPAPPPQDVAAEAPREP